MSAKAHDGTGDHSGNGSLDKDKTFEILSNERRRHILDILSRTDHMDKGELATLVTVRETGKPKSKINSTERKNVLVGLHQCHLPKLADYGVINYEDDTVSLKPGNDALLSYLRFNPDASIPAKIKYVGTSLF